jgi:outer membrane immunogenic protein
MKRIFFGIATASLVMAAGVAGAADMAVKAAAAPCQCSCDAAKFAGGYLGISGGAVKDIANRTDQGGFINRLGNGQSEGTLVLEKWGGIVGGQIGYNWTTCHTLWGIEIDGSWASVTNSIQLGVEPPAGFLELHTKMHSFVSGRARAGIAMDNMLLYLTGGVAASEFKTLWQRTPTLVADYSDWRWGWTAGFGTEWAWTDRLSIKAEVLYANFTDRDHSVRFTQLEGNPLARFRDSDALWITRIGLNYRFGGAR